MTVAVHAVRELHYADESSFGELLQTTTYRIPVSEVRVETTSGRSSDASLQNRLAESRPGFLLPRSGGTLDFDCDFAGALVDTATGALAATWLQKLLADGLGGGDLTQVGGVAGASATTTALTNATGTRTRGAIVRVGRKGDAAADGQAAVIGNPDTSLLTALPSAPGATDVVRACLMSYPKETLGAAKRFIVGFNSTLANGAQYAFHGCQLSGLTLKIDHAGIPQVTLQYRYAYWRDLTGFTIPSAVTLEDCKSAVSAGGSYLLQSVGTTTRALVQASACSLAVTLGLQAQIGQGGVASLQNIIGWVRTGIGAQLTLTIPWDSANATEYDSDGSDTTHKHFLACLSAGGGTTATEGRHVGFYLPRIYPIGARPAFTNWNGLVYQDVVFATREGTDTTTDLSRSAFRFYQS
jgi:hypothetical protein